MTDEVAVRITVRGRVGHSLRTAFAPLGAEIAPRHNVIVVGSGEVRDLVVLLKALEQREVVVDRITHPGTVAPDHEDHRHDCP